MKLKRPEDAFLDNVMQLARHCGWTKVVHFRPARTAKGWRTAGSGDVVGWPDLLLIHPPTGTLIVAELKIPPNVCTPEQESWLQAFRDADIAAYVWTPDSWAQIEDVLARRA